MADALRLRLLEREVELMCHFALIVAEDLEKAAQTENLEETPILLQALIATVLKISHLLWPFGRRVTDQISVDEAATLRTRMALEENSPLAPPNVAPLVPILTMSREELLGAVDLPQRAVVLAGEAHPIRPLIETLAGVRAELASGE